MKLFGKSKARAQKSETESVVETAPAASDNKSAEMRVQEEVAAIALAIKMFQEEQHILESTVITINLASRVYSPWNSKIHGIPPFPVRS